MAYDPNKLPKKNPLSLQIDLSKFELATDEEKHQQERMRESTTFFQDGIRRLKKNVVSMVCLVIVALLTLTAFIVPIFYPYDYSSSSASKGSNSANFLAPMQYSIKETILMEEDAIFLGWAYPNEKQLEGYKGLKPIDSQEYLDQVKDLFITDAVEFTNKNLEIFAVWGVDKDHDGKADFGADLFHYDTAANVEIDRPLTEGEELVPFKLAYNMNMGEGTKPVDNSVYYAGDKVVPVSKVNFTKPYQKVFPHILGTDEIGRDYATRVLVGARISLLVGIIAAIIVVIIGVLYGAISGYFGGKVDLIMMRIVDIIYSMPDTLIVILLSVSMKDIVLNSSFNKIASKLGGVGLISILIVFAMLYWVGMARLVRGQVLSLREQEYVLAAKAMGVPPLKIIFKHMLPNCISVIFISAALQIPSAIFTESFLSFLGIGVSIPMPSLGSLASDYRGQMTIAGRGYLFLIPSVVIFLIVLSLNLLGQGLRDSFDPKLREVDK